MREILEESIRRLLSEQITPERVREAEAGAWDEALWAVLEDSGFTLALVREASGGSGLSWADAYPVVAAAGEHVLPLPLPETMLAAWLLDQAGLAVPAGAIGIADPALAAPVQARRQDGACHLYGRAVLVPWGRFVRHLVVVAEAEGRAHLALVDTGGLDWRHDANLAREPRDTLVLDGQRAQALVPWPAGVPSMRVQGALLRSAQMAGAMEGLVQQSVRYVGERVQFGRAIGQFQAVQQQLALLGCASASATAAAAHAFGQAGTPGAWLATAAAKAGISESAGQAAAIAHAAHGAIGFAYEHVLHFATRRLWSWRSEFGHHGWWAQRIGESLCSGDEPFWHVVTRGYGAGTSTPGQEQG